MEEGEGQDMKVITIVIRLKTGKSFLTFCLSL